MTEPALYARMELRIKDFERQLKRAELAAERGTSRIGKGADRAARQLETRMTAMSGRVNAALVGAFAGVATFQGARQLLDASTRITNSLKVAGLQGETLEGVYRKLFASAQENAAPIETLVNLYSRLSLSQKELNASSDDLISFTGNIALALKVAGSDAATASGALTQLAQALGGGVVRAEEFNSILEGAQPIVRAAAAGISEAGGSISKLRTLMLDGKVSSEAFFRGVQAGSVVLEKMASGSVPTISQQFTNLRTTLIDIAREFDKNAQASRAAGQAFSFLTDEVVRFGKDLQPFISDIKGVIGWIEAIGTAATNAGADLREMLGGSREPWLMIGGGSEPATKITINKKRRAGSSRRGGAVMAPPVAPNAISLEDYEVPGAGKKNKKQRQSDYERMTALVRERAAAIEAETAAQAGLNPLIEEYGFAVEKARAAHDLLTAAQESGLAITPELEASIDKLATEYAVAAASANKLAEEQGRLQDRWGEMNALGKDVLGGFVSDLQEGVSAADALTNALGRIADKLLEIALNDLFNPAGSGAGGILGVLFGGFSGGRPPGFVAGGYTGPGGKYQPAGVVHKNEVVWSQDDVRRAGGVSTVEAMRRGLAGYASGGAVSAPRMPRMPSPESLRPRGGGLSVSYTAPNVSIGAGASPESVAELRRVFEDDRRNFEARTVRAIQNAQRRNIRI